jgi:hypothetical protein
MLQIDDFGMIQNPRVCGARRLAIERHPVEIRALSRFNPTAENQREIKKTAPERYPANSDAIGIELVGKPDAQGVYEPPSPAQNESLAWLMGALSDTLNVPLSEVFRHPDVSRKNPSEAAGARW